jgi:carbonic anhydrase
MPEFPSAAFADVLAANGEFAEHFSGQHLTGQAMRGLAIITCMDSRIAPLAIVGMQAGDVKILRNAGARVTEDVLRTLVLAVHLLGVNRVLVMPHTECKMASASEDEIHAALTKSAGIDTRSLDIQTVVDQEAALRRDLIAIRALPYLPDDLAVGGAIYNVTTGRLRPVDD